MDSIQPLIGRTFNCTASGRVSARAFREVRDKICTWYDKSWRDIEPVLAEVGTTWMIVDKKESASGITGTWPKRIASYLYKRLDIELEDDEKARIGEIGKRGMTTADYTGRITGVIDWEDGDFGDEDSCFWSSRSEARQIIPANGGGAVLFYDGDEVGRARCLFVPVAPGLVIFNAYGDLSLESVADALAPVVGCATPYQITLLDHGEWQLDDMWINGGKGILLPEIETDHVQGIDLMLVRPKFCKRCAHLLTGNVEDDYCPDCLAQAHVCQSCGSPYFVDMLDEDDNRPHVCRDCLSRDYARCEHCHGWLRRDEVVVVGSPNRTWITWRVHANCVEDMTTYLRDHGIIIEILERNHA